MDNNDTDGILLPNGSRLNCLLYADDLVLMSNSTKGLQNALTILSQFCEDWLLNVSAKKTKILIFQKKCRKSTYEKQHFFINGNKIEIVNNYTYLGMNVSSNGHFRINKINLMEKTRRSIFATRRYLDFSKLSIHLANKIFDSLFLPILTHGSEVNISNLNDNSNCSKLISHLKLNVKNEFIYHQIKLLNTNRILNFHCIFKKDTLKTEFLDTITCKNPVYIRSA